MTEHKTNYRSLSLAAIEAMKKSYSPRLVTFVQNKEGATDLIVVNDTLDDFGTKVIYGMKTIAGEFHFNVDLSSLI